MTNGGTGFFNDLFDFDFDRLVTVRVVKVLYIIGVVVIGLAGVAFLVTALAGGGGTAVLGLVLIPLLTLFYVIILRVSLEVAVVLFKIKDAAESLAASGSAGIEPGTQP